MNILSSPIGLRKIGVYNKAYWSTFIVSENSDAATRVAVNHTHLCRLRILLTIHEITTDECRVVDVEALLTFHRCRAARPAGQYFTMNECSAGQVINIQSAVLGYSVLYNLNTHPPRCPWLNCTSPTDEPARLCNGRRSCNISQEILIYPKGSALCSQQKDGNFIRITFTCVTGMISPSLLYFIAHYSAWLLRLVAVSEMTAVMSKVVLGLRQRWQAIAERQSYTRILVGPRHQLMYQPDCVMEV